MGMYPEYTKRHRWSPHFRTTHAARPGVSRQPRTYTARHTRTITDQHTLSRQSHSRLSRKSVLVPSLQCASKNIKRCPPTIPKASGQFCGVACGISPIRRKICSCVLERCWPPRGWHTAVLELGTNLPWVTVGRVTYSSLNVETVRPPHSETLARCRSG